VRESNTVANAVCYPKRDAECYADRDAVGDTIAHTNSDCKTPSNPTAAPDAASASLTP
jgi:hypothetical protein